MAINVQHGPISTALGLAAVSGAGIARRQNQREDLAMLDLVARMKADADRRRATEIESALMGQKIASDQQAQAQRMALAGQELAAEQDFRQQQLAGQAEDRSIRRQQLDAQAAMAQQRQAASEQQWAAQHAYISGLPDGPEKQQALAYFNATGKLPETVIPQNASQARPFRLDNDPRVQFMKFELNKLKDDLDMARRAKSSYITATGGMVDANDPMLAQVTEAETAARQAYEAKFKALRDYMQAVQEAVSVEQKTQAVNTAPLLQAMTQGQQSEAQQGQIPVINTAEEYQQLPPGSLYIDAADGQTYRKGS